MIIIKKKLIISLLILVASGICQAQFLDSFNNKKIEGWFFFTGDGAATMNFVQKDGFARLYVDAAKDKYNVYWTLIKRDVSATLDLNVNFMINTQRTTNYHEHLMEFDKPDTSNWHIISMI